MNLRVPVFQLDAFTDRRFAGNPAAVVVLEDFFEDSLLQAIAAENNLPETAFVVPSTGAYRLRWFTPRVEVPLCGHATLASGAVVLERLEASRAGVVFDTVSGPLTVDREGAGYRMELPARAVRLAARSDALAVALGVEAVETTLDSAGNYIVRLVSAELVRSLEPDIAAIGRLDCTGVIVTAAGDGPYDFVSRYFAPSKGIPEDPVTGGAHCALVPYWAARTGKEELFAQQVSQRGGEIVCRLIGDRVQLNGSCVFYLEGHIDL